MFWGWEGSQSKSFFNRIHFVPGKQEATGNFQEDISFALDHFQLKKHFGHWQYDFIKICELWRWWRRRCGCSFCIDHRIKVRRIPLNGLGPVVDRIDLSILFGVLISGKAHWQHKRPDRTNTATWQPETNAKGRTSQKSFFQRPDQGDNNENGLLCCCDNWPISDQYCTGQHYFFPPLFECMLCNSINS